MLAVAGLLNDLDRNAVVGHGLVLVFAVVDLAIRCFIGRTFFGAAGIRGDLQAASRLHLDALLLLQVRDVALQAH